MVVFFSYVLISQLHEGKHHYVYFYFFFSYALLRTKMCLKISSCCKNYFVYRVVVYDLFDSLGLLSLFTSIKFGLTSTITIIFRFFHVCLLILIDSLKNRIPFSSLVSWQRLYEYKLSPLDTCDI